MKRILACVFITAVLPLMIPPTQSTSPNPAPFATVAFAGHTSIGGWCDCGEYGCDCDEDDQPDEATSAPADHSTRAPIQGTTSAMVGPTSGFDFGSGGLMLALAVFLWTRLRG